MRFYSRVSDLSLVPWIAVFKRRVVALYNQGIRWYDKHEVTNQFWVQMRINGDSLYVNINSFGVAYFEFHTTGYPVLTYNSDTYYEVAVVAVTFNGLTPVAEIMGGQRVPSADAVSLIKRPNQVQLLDEPAVYSNVGGGLAYPQALYESWAPAHSHTGLHFNSYNCRFLPFGYNAIRGSMSAHSARDVRWDIGYMDGSKRDPVRRAYLRGTTDWPRASGRQTVTDDVYGTREFAIYVDAFDQVSVFPISEIDPLAGVDGSGDPLQNVDSSMVQTQRVSFPAWVYAKTQKFSSWYAANPGDLGESQFPEYDWKLHPDGTAMCAVVYERVLAELDTAYYAPYATDTGTLGPSQFFPDATSFQLFNDQACGIRTQFGSVNPAGEDYYMQAPGILEVGINIEITGDLPQDFSLSLTVTEVRRPTTTPYCTFVAGYTWHDVKDPRYTNTNPLYYARRGDLVVMDIECYGRYSDGMTASLLSVKNLDMGGAEIFTLNAGTTSTIVAPSTVLFGYPTLLAYNMATLSFAMKISNDIEDGTNHRTLHFGIAIYVMGRYQGTLFPETIDAGQQTYITDNAKDMNARARMEFDFPGLSLMSLNDLRDWTDGDLSALREHYTMDTAQFGTYSPPENPLNNFAEIETAGHKYYNTAGYSTTVSANASTWYNKMMVQLGYRPFPIFDITEPRPGWYLYMGELMTRMAISAHTTFFTHPSGTWAFYNHEFFYNKNGMSFDPMACPDGIVGFDPALVEHCIFDRVHFAIESAGNYMTTDTTFMNLYNLAIQKGERDETLLDTATVMAKLNQQAQLGVTVVADSVDPTVSYMQLQIDWYGSTLWYTEYGYFDGTKDFGTGFESPCTGGLQDFSLGAFVQNSFGGTSLVIPMAVNMPPTFSSCTFITG